MEEQKTDTNWLQKEAETIKTEVFDGERLPALKLEENKIADIEIDFSKEFDIWTSDEGAIKKIIPVTFKGEKLVWWLNVKNPIYGKLIHHGFFGKTKFKVLQTGSQQNTKYTLIDDDQDTLPKEVSSQIM